MKIEKLIGIAELIAKDISNQITDTEKLELDKWKNLSKKNAILYKKLYQWEDYKKRNNSYFKIDIDKGWDVVSEKISKRYLRPVVSIYMKYAVAVLVFIIMTFGSYRYLQRIGKQKNSTASVTSIVPGTNAARIILANGNIVNLDQERISRVPEKGGIIIQKEEGVLIYPKADKNIKKLASLKNTLIIPQGGEYKVVLSDSTVVFLNSMSELTYPVVFDENKRELYLKGEAYFKVKKMPDKPFIVHFGDAQIKVLGTSFNIKAYDDENNIYATLVEGKIEISSEENSGKYILNPNQQAVIKKDINKIEVRKVDANIYVGWKDGIYMFSNESLYNIMKSLSRWYKFQFEFSNEALKNIHFTGGFNKYEDITPILDIITSTNKVKIKVVNNKIILM